ncbi:MAG TPA: D-Ala-D-Ala carboxypeptidase family metallohydrolase, partial [Thermoleophilia bacterium]|nr:D-Ala-D-Ala carboxypeptidase family metallohydrolase [Thermoleophilia bacterium]
LCARAWTVLEPIREAVARPVRVTSGYRSPAVNAAVGGSSRSQHSKGEAADIKVDGMAAPELRNAIVAAGVPFDQLIWYAPERGGHVHVSYAIGRTQRGQVIYAPAGGGYIANP